MLNGETNVRLCLFTPSEALFIIRAHGVTSVRTCARSLVCGLRLVGIKTLDAPPSAEIEATLKPFISPC